MIIFIFKDNVCFNKRRDYKGNRKQVCYYILSFFSFSHFFFFVQKKGRSRLILLKKRTLDVQGSTFSPFTLFFFAYFCKSIDLRLGNEFRFFKPAINKTIRIEEESDFMDVTEKVVLKEGETYLLLPGQACLSITKETIRLSNNICGLLEGRSKMLFSREIISFFANFFEI